MAQGDMNGAPEERCPCDILVSILSVQPRCYFHFRTLILVKMGPFIPHHHTQSVRFFLHFPSTKMFLAITHLRRSICQTSNQNYEEYALLTSKWFLHRVNKFDLWIYGHSECFTKIYSSSWGMRVLLSACSRGWSYGSLFNSYYSEV